MKKIIDIETLRKKCLPKGDKVEPGFFTKMEYQEAWDLSESRVNALLQRAVQSGVMERKMFKIPSGGNQLRHVAHYKDIS